MRGEGVKGSSELFREFIRFGEKGSTPGKVLFLALFLALFIVLLLQIVRFKVLNEVQLKGLN